MIINWFYDLFDSIKMSDLVAFTLGGGFGYSIARAWWG